MKAIIFSVLSLFAFQASASCPPLAGSYTCDYDGFSLGVTVSEQKNARYSSYLIDYMVGKLLIHADGKMHTIDRIAGFDKARNFKYRANCKGRVVNFSGTGDMTDGSGKATLRGSLTQQAKGVVIRLNLKTTETQSITLGCKKD